MFERYSEEARRAIFFARYECSQYGSPTIESEHLLLGLLRETTLLKRLLGKDQEPKILRAEVEKQIIRRPHIPPSTEMPFSTECTRILRLAVEESERLGHGYVEPEHLLLGLLREEQCLGARILQVHDVTLLRTREEVTRQGQGSKPNFSRVAPSPRIRVDPAVWKFGSYLAAIRLVALWSIVIGFRYSDWRQVPGYFAQFLVFPEALITRRVLNDQARWTADLALLIFANSYLYAWIVVRLRPKGRLRVRRSTF